jgi:pimeloyl-ACP methyl ester carboxylesterase
VLPSANSERGPSRKVITMTGDVVLRLLCRKPQGTPGMAGANLRVETKRRQLTVMAGWLFVLAALAACASPVSAVRIDDQTMQRSLDTSALTGDRLSETTQIVLRRRGLLPVFGRDPGAAISALQALVAAGRADRKDLFALAEASFLLGRGSGDRSRFLAAAVYAFAYLFPGDGAPLPNPFDPTLRQAADLYGRGLTAAFASADGTRLELRSGQYTLPFGTLDLVLDKSSLRWGNAELTEFAPGGNLQVHGLQNIHRLPGLGAPVAAGIKASPGGRGFQVTQHVRVPATVLMVIPDARAAIASGILHGVLSVHTFFDDRTVTIDGWRVPLEYRLTASIALALQESNVWAREFRGFLFGDLLSNLPSQLVALEPHRAGRIPVVLVHGTASSVGRWADMINDLLADPRIDDHFEFWLFSYATGASIPYSALLLRRSLEETFAQLGTPAADPALGQTVVIGHSLGGLLAKMLVIDPDSRLWDAISRRPFEDLRMSPTAKALIRNALFVQPLPEVKRVVFIATPHRGSYVAAMPISQFVGRLVTLPVDVALVGSELLANNADEPTFDVHRGWLGSVYGMTPGSTFIRALASVPVVPDVEVNSIIPTLGNGPLAQRTDGVVSYASAHIEPVESELVVHSGHSTQSTPATIEEVRRILLYHLALACRAEPPANSPAFQNGICLAGRT